MLRRASVPGLTTGSQEVCGRYGAQPSVTDGAATEALGSATAASAPVTGPAASPPVSPPVSSATASAAPRPRRPLPRPAAPPYRTLCSRPRRWPVTPSGIMLGRPSSHLNPICPTSGKNLEDQRCVDLHSDRRPRSGMSIKDLSVRSRDLRQRRPVRPADLPGDVPRLLEGPLLRDPVGHQLVQLGLDVGPDEPVDDPPRHVGVGADPLGRVEVDAAEQLGLLLVEQGIVERLVRLDLALVPLEVLAVLLDR